MEPAGTRPDDAARLKQLFDDHAGRLYAYCLRRAGDDAEELVAETFLVAWRRIDVVPAEPLPWLFNVAGNLIANRRRGDRRREAFLTTMKAVERSRTVAAADPADEVATRFTVLQILDRLPPAEREALMLTAWDGLDVREGAKAAGCSRATFSVRLHRARRRVMKELEATRHPLGEAPDAGHMEIGEAR